MAAARDVGFAGGDGEATMGPERNEERAAGLGSGGYSFLTVIPIGVSSDEIEWTAGPGPTVVADAASLNLLPLGRMT